MYLKLTRRQAKAVGEVLARWTYSSVTPMPAEERVLLIQVLVKLNAAQLISGKQMELIDDSVEMYSKGLKI